jgi:hypothetical protein
VPEANILGAATVGVDLLAGVGLVELDPSQRR